MRRNKGQTGMSLVEATIILLVLMLLTSVLAPSIFDFVIDAKMVKVKEDCEAIGIAVARMTRDVGPCFRKYMSNSPCSAWNHVGLLYSDGTPIVAQRNDMSNRWEDPTGRTGHWGWYLAEQGLSGNADSMEHQFVTNKSGLGQLYATPADLHTYNVTMPAFNLGWRGAYLSPQIGPDPWGNKYVVNVFFMTVAYNCSDNHGCEGDAGWSHDVFCLSSGPNVAYETPFAQAHPTTHGTERIGDDFIFIISGDTR